MSKLHIKEATNIVKVFSKEQLVKLVKAHKLRNVVHSTQAVIVDLDVLTEFLKSAMLHALEEDVLVDFLHEELKIADRKHTLMAMARYLAQKIIQRLSSSDKNQIAES